MNIRKGKRLLEKFINMGHTTKNIYSIVSKRSEVYRKIFMKIYDERCCYCGVSLDVIPNRNFQIDHFIHQESDLFKGENRLSNTDPGDIRNIVLACSFCNSNKSDFQFSNNRMHIYPFHPDKNINDVFQVNNADYSIFITPKYSQNREIKAFYDKLDLGNYIHQLDCLIMHLKELWKKENNEKIKGLLGSCFVKLIYKRNQITDVRQI